jgi:predicted RNase H-like HicB family nuclease
MSQTFLVNLIFDPEYHGYVADVPRLPGCMSQGKTVEAALKNVRQAIRAYIRALTNLTNSLLKNSTDPSF